MRVLVLVAGLGVAAGVERWRLGAQANRWREYSFLLVTACLGALVGLLNDSLTSRLSPDYFVLGKGIPSGPEFALEVARLALHAGFLAGAVCGGALLLAARPKDGGAVLRLGWSLLGPLVGALALAPLGYLLGPTVYPSDDWPRTYLDASAWLRFRQVWGIHAALYVGALLGLGLALWRARARNKPSPSDSSPA